jgi:general stress protein 26
MKRSELKKIMIDLVKSYPFSNLITIGPKGIPKGRMMAHLPLGNDMVFWFATSATSNKIKEITRNKSSCVFVYRPTDHSSVTACGKAQVIKDDKTRKKYWQDAWKAYWPAGPKDPNYVLIRLAPKRLEYLDYPNHKLEVLEL